MELLKPDGDRLRVCVGGQWRMGDVSPGQNGELDPVLRAIDGGGIRRLTLSAAALGSGIRRFWFFWSILSRLRGNAASK
ncbi:MAG: hypothetical protein LBR31_05835 [Desulfovibrio sp.]|nr:hypothetical protein [Desulfovibrio sp.]